MGKIKAKLTLKQQNLETKWIISLSSGSPPTLFIVVNLIPQNHMTGHPFITFLTPSDKVRIHRTDTERDREDSLAIRTKQNKTKNDNIIFPSKMPVPVILMFYTIPRIKKEEQENVLQIKQGVRMTSTNPSHRKGQ